MSIPSVNRARIEKLNREIVALQQEVSSLQQEFDAYDPIVYDDSFPDTLPTKPMSVRASGLFRNIQVMWAFDRSTYISAYEVYASKNAGFTPVSTDLVWSGLDSGYTHKASLGETWYFKVRAINTHGTPSEYSDEVSASTTQVVDVEIDSHYTNGVVSDANQYTDERKNEIMDEVAYKADGVYAYDNILLSERKFTKSDIPPEDTAKLWFDSINQVFMMWDNATSTWVSADTLTLEENSVNTDESGTTLKSSSVNMDIRMGDVVGRIDSAETNIETNAYDITLRATKTEYNALEGRVSTAEADIVTNAESIVLKASQTDLNTTNERLDTAVADITVNADEIALRVEKNGVIGAINLSSELAQIDVAKVQINGDLEVINGLVTLKDLVVDSVHIKDGAIVDRMFADNVIANHINAGTATIDFAKIGDVSVTSAQIVSLDATKINASSLSAISANLGTVTAGVINGVQINSANINITEDITLGSNLKMGAGLSNQSILFGETGAEIRHRADGGIELKATAVYLTNKLRADYGVLSNGYDVLTTNDFGTYSNNVARGNHTHSGYALINHDHDSAYVKQYYSGDTIQMYVSGDNRLVVRKNGSTVGSVTLS